MATEKPTDGGPVERMRVPRSAQDNRQLLDLNDVPSGALSRIDLVGTLGCVAYRELPAMFAVLADRLAPYGVLDVVEDDFEAVAKAFVDNQKDDYLGRLYGPQDGPYDVKRTFFTRPMLANLARRAGLKSVVVQSDGLRLRMTARKRTAAALAAATGKRKPVIEALISLPRLAFTENWYTSFQSLPPLGIRMSRYTGAFWEQGISRMLYPIIEKGEADYVLTVDYDSVFTAEQVLELIELMEENPQAAAIFPMQSRRDRRHPIIGMQDKDGKWRAEVPVSEFSTDLTPAVFGHFGLTMLRCSVLRDIAHPWLWGRPNAEGRWDEGKVDADIAFWMKLKDTGHAVYQANGVRILHGEYMYAIPGPDLAPVYIHSNDWEERGWAAVEEALASISKQEAA